MIYYIYQETSEDGLVHEAEEGPLNDCRSALQQALKAYMVQGRFPSPQSAGSVHIKNGNIHVNISAEKPNLRNFWSGKWSSSWVVTMPPDNVFSSAASIAGEIKVSLNSNFVARDKLFTVNACVVFCRFMLIILKMAMYR